MMLPIGSGLFVRLCFHAVAGYKKECKRTRIDIENNLVREIAGWKNEI